jgi:hypothetical protein
MRPILLRVCIVPSFRSMQPIVARISLNRLELASITPCHCERSEAISFCKVGIASSLRSSQ